VITPAHAQLMACYNTWQNLSLYTAADTLSDAHRKMNRGAFWNSIHSTLNHLLWGDEQWMSRFANWPAPTGHNIPAMLDGNGDWATLKAARQTFDAKIEAWADDLTDEWLAAEVTWYSGAAGRELSKPAWLLVTHFFNHETHHRGQVHVMLTQAGAKPDDTDLFLTPGQ
jgi:uncharacterized damage-inducible protein DinB